MSDSTLTHGIDLGTTNSVICRLNGTRPEPIKNQWQEECTPSAVREGLSGRLEVGREAFRRRFEDGGNVAVRFKRRMGSDWSFTFARTGRRLSAVELSTAVLGELKQAALQRSLATRLPGAVITIPAVFPAPACSAVHQAAEAAGLLHHPLLQEPVAAALAYGVTSDVENVHWLVYDLGGGTFDSALVNLRDGTFRVVTSNGDDDLGGGLLDEAIVRQLLVPAIARQSGRRDFNPSEDTAPATWSKLMIRAEEAKIMLSTARVASIEINSLPIDDRGTSIDFQYELRREAVEALMEPLVRRSIAKCRDTIASGRIGIDHIEKVLLVGGPTLMPYVRERLADAREGLGIPLALDRDPLTVVAEGAALFSAGYRITDGGNGEGPRTGRVIELEYKPLVPDPEFMVGGRVVPEAGGGPEELTIEFVNGAVSPPWRSGPIQCGGDGKFIAHLFAERNVANVFAIELRDSERRVIPTTPASITVRVGHGGEQHFTNSLSIGLADDGVLWLARKDAPIPFRSRREVLRTVSDIRPGQHVPLLQVPLLEGESPRASRNEKIGALVVGAEHIVSHLVPAGSEVEVEVIVDALGDVRMKVYVPLFGRDGEFEQRFDYRGFRAKPMSVDELTQALKAAGDRLSKYRGEAAATDDKAANDALRRIAAHHMVEDVEQALAESRGDPNAAERCGKRIRELNMALDEVEDALEWPRLVARANEMIDRANSILSSAAYHPTPSERELNTRLQREARDAIARRDEDVLKIKAGELSDLGDRILIREPAQWSYELQTLERKLPLMSDQAAARAWYNRGLQARQANNGEGLRGAVLELWKLLPETDPDRRRHDSTVVKH